MLLPLLGRRRTPDLGILDLLCHSAPLKGVAGLEIWGLRIELSRSYLSGGVSDFGFGDSGLRGTLRPSADILDFGFGNSGFRRCFTITKGQVGLRTWDFELHLVPRTRYDLDNLKGTPPPTPPSADDRTRILGLGFGLSPRPS